MNEFWEAVKLLEGRTVGTVEEAGVTGGVRITCSDGVQVIISIDDDDGELTAQASRGMSGIE